VEILATPIRFYFAGELPKAGHSDSDKIYLRIVRICLPDVCWVLTLKYRQTGLPIIPELHRFICPTGHVPLWHLKNRKAVFIQHRQKNSQIRVLLAKGRVGKD
jgi:hypothetical protein